jgi:hypothetical protein
MLPTLLRLERGMVGLGGLAQPGQSIGFQTRVSWVQILHSPLSYRQR